MNYGKLTDVLSVAKIISPKRRDYHSQLKEISASFLRKSFPVKVNYLKVFRHTFNKLVSYYGAFLLPIYLEIKILNSFIFRLISTFDVPILVPFLSTTFLCQTISTASINSSFISFLYVIEKQTKLLNEKYHREKNVLYMYY